MWIGCRDAKKKTREIHTLNVQNIYGIPCLWIGIERTTNSGSVKEWRKIRIDLGFMVASKRAHNLIYKLHWTKKCWVKIRKEVKEK
jgi:hypothetical protein